MYKSIICLFIFLSLSSCAFVHKPEIEQGNIITADMVNRLHTGMSEGQVKEVMGNPILVNIFSPQRMEFVYTYQKGNATRREQRISCLFKNGRLVDIQRTM